MASPDKMQLDTTLSSEPAMVPHHLPGLLRQCNICSGWYLKLNLSVSLIAWTGRDGPESTTWGETAPPIRSNVTACLRCKSRKQRCDQGIPACSNCERAGVECVSVDPDGGITPRNYIKALEDRVAQLEIQLANRNHQNTYENAPNTHNHSHNPDLPSPASPFTSRPSPDTNNATTRAPENGSRSMAETQRAAPGSNMGLNFSMGLPTQFPLLTLLMPNQNTFSVSESAQTQNRPLQSLVEQLPTDTNVIMPADDVVRRLVMTYFEHSDFFLPIFQREAFLATMQELFDSRQAALPIDAVAEFRTFMALAVAMILLNRADSSIPTSHAQSYFHAALRIFASAPNNICEGELACLENLLVMVQYMMFASDLRAAWHVLGICNRIVLGLELHVEPRDEGACTRSDDRTTRRRLFWATYSMDRLLSSVLRRPFSIPEESIETCLPEVERDDENAAMANHLILHRRLDSEIYTTMHSRSPVNGATLDHRVWREGMRERLLRWAATRPPFHKSSRFAPDEIFQGSLEVSLALLYCPSRHIPTLFDNELIFLAQKATDVIAMYRALFKDGCLRFYWRTCHNLFHCGAALIHCIRTLTASGYASADIGAMRQSVSLCSAVLWGMVERYPAGASYRDTFEKLVAIANDQVTMHAGSTWSLSLSTGDAAPGTTRSTTIADGFESFGFDAPDVDSLFSGHFSVPTHD